MSAIKFEDGQIILGSYTLPGLYASSEVGKSLRFDEQKGTLSGSKKVPTGWDDAAITITLDLTSDDNGQSCYDKLEELNNIFSGYDNKANPQVWDIDNRHLAARGIRRVIFASLNTRDNSQNDIIQCTLQFSEYFQPIIKKEKDVAQGGTVQSTAQKPNKTTAGKSNGQPVKSDILLVDLN